MENNLLSLKNIYRLFTVNDYPIFSNGVIKDRDKKGLTLVKFWKQILIYDFRNTNSGKIIWRTEGSRNRYHSELCNRNNDFKFYNEYISEIAACINSELYYQQAELFASFFEEKRCSFSILEDKMSTYLKIVQKEDPCVTKEIGSYFLDKLGEIKLQKSVGEEYKSYLWGCFTGMLMLHAIAGPEMGGAQMTEIRNLKQLQSKYMWNQYAQKEFQRDQVQYLTYKAGEIYRAPLAADHFFGREIELFELKEMVKAGGRYSICGMGGIGKTELLRQLLQICQRESVVDCIAAVSYEENLSSSFARSFAFLSGKGREERFQECLNVLQTHRKDKVLLMLDNVDEKIRDDPDWNRLQELSCTIIVTTRLKQIKDFQNFEIKLLDKNAAALVFRDVFGGILSEMDRKSLNLLMEQEIYQHTLTVRFLGKAAKSWKWSVEQLKECLGQQPTKITWRDKNATHNLSGLYQQLYRISHLSVSQQRCLRLFAVLPYRTYDTKFVDKFVSVLSEPDEDIREILDDLTERGWLEKEEGGYSMHPVTAESIRTRNLSEKEFEPFWKQMDKNLNSEKILCQGAAKTEEAADIAEILYYVVVHWKGNISGRMVFLTLKAGYFMYVENGFQKQTLETVSALYESCQEKTGEMRLYLCMMEMYQQGSDTEDSERELEKMEKEGRTCGILFLEFCWLLCSSLNLLGKYEKSEYLVHKYLDKSPIPYYQICGKFLLGDGMKMRMQLKEAIECLEEGIRLQQKSADGGKDKPGQHKSENNHIFYNLCYQLAESYLLLGQVEPAREKLQLLREGIKETKNSYIRMMCSQLSGNIELADGNTGQAAVYLQEVKNLTEIYNGKNDYNYWASCVSLGIIQNRMGAWDAALDNYQESLYQMEKNKVEVKELVQIINNNIGVTYLDSDRPEKALPYLEKAYEMSAGMGELARAEPAYNLSRACEKMKNAREEQKYLREAYPVLLKNYGEEHVKTKDAKRRLKMMEGEII
ncbi:MAG: tetratricopeptide repeat protein [Lachnospiraceae bacterium]|nr:tetratricopeptide repeat protein [Lachnospiraceae bacterium]